MSPSTQYLVNLTHSQFDLGIRDAKRMLSNGYDRETLLLTTNDFLSRHPDDKYWQGVKTYANRASMVSLS